MLRVLVISFLFFAASAVYAQGRFFDEKVDFFKPAEQEYNATSQCESCAAAQAKTEFTLGKAEKVTREIEKGVQQKVQPQENSVSVIIEPNCRFSLQAVETTGKFLQTHPAWIGQGYLVTGLVDLKSTVASHKELLDKGISFTIDSAGGFCKRFGVTKTPAFIIFYKEKYYKVFGQPDLEDLIAKL